MQMKPKNTKTSRKHKCKVSPQLIIILQFHDNIYMDGKT